MTHLHTNPPLHRRKNWIIKLISLFLKTNLGKRIAFFLGIKGFDRVSFKLIRNGKVILQGITFNARVDKGAALQASLMAGSALGGITSPSAPLYIALSTSVLSPAKTDTTLAGETTVSGLARALGVAQNYVQPSTLDGAASYEVFKSFTLTGANTTIQSTGLFDAATGGNLFAEANFSNSVPMATNDILEVTWTINI